MFSFFVEELFVYIHVTVLNCIVFARIQLTHQLLNRGVGKLSHVNILGLIPFILGQALFKAFLHKLDECMVLQIALNLRTEVAKPTRLGSSQDPILQLFDLVILSRDLFFQDNLSLSEVHNESFHVVIDFAQRVLDVVNDIDGVYLASFISLCLRLVQIVPDLIGKLFMLRVSLGCCLLHRCCQIASAQVLEVLFELLVSRVKLLHDRLGNEQSFFQLLCVEALKICHAEALICVSEKRLLGH